LDGQPQSVCELCSINVLPNAVSPGNKNRIILKSV